MFTRILGVTRPELLLGFEQIGPYAIDAIVCHLIPAVGSKKCLFRCMTTPTARAQEHACGYWPPELNQNLEFVDAIFDWMAANSCIDTSKASGFIQVNSFHATTEN